MEKEKIRILLVEDNKDFAKLVSVYLQRFEKDKFQITWKENYHDTIKELEQDPNYDIVLMDYFLPGKNGLEITKELKAKKFNFPIIFLTVNKDFDLAVDVMKIGVDDYLVKEEISSPILPKTVLSVIEKHRLRDHLMQLEISQQRLKAIRETLMGVVGEFQPSINEMKSLSDDIKSYFPSETHSKYIKIIEENVHRIHDKLEKLKSLKEYRTVKYIKDIKMIDLSA
ncbi:MAG: response regulator [Ignavibacteriales bacterium]|nr:response regulator [Ignavibacteriales bacterium]